MHYSERINNLSYQTIDEAFDILKRNGICTEQMSMDTIREIALSMVDYHKEKQKG